MSKILITGGAGFIGYHLCKKLVDLGHEVVVYDANKHWILPEKSFFPLYSLYRIRDLGNKIVREMGDTTDRGRFSEVMEKHNPEFVVHLAALPISDVSNKFPSEARVNIEEGTLTVLEVLKERFLKGKKIKRFLYTSSSMVYGNFKKDNDNNPIPAKESDKLDPICIYGSFKVCGELLTRVYTRKFGIPHTIIRPSAVYGPTDSNRRVTEIFLNNAILGKPLRLDNGGLVKLDFTYVEDLIDGFVLILNSDKSVNETFNLTRGEGRSLKELAAIIKHLIPNIQVVEKKVEVYRPERGALDISKARKLLGYNPKYGLEEGMEKYLYFVNSVGIVTKNADSLYGL